MFVESVENVSQSYYRDPNKFAATIHKCMHTTNKPFNKHQLNVAFHSSSNRFGRYQITFSTLKPQRMCKRAKKKKAEETKTEAYK